MPEGKLLQKHLVKIELSNNIVNNSSITIKLKFGNNLRIIVFQILYDMAVSFNTSNVRYNILSDIIYCLVLQSQAKVCFFCTYIYKLQM